VSLRSATDVRALSVGDADRMPSTQYPSIIERSAEAAHVWYRDTASELGTEDLHYAGRALRAVLHALRDRLTVEEAAQLASQLPTLIRGIYYEQWKPGATKHLAHDVDAFLEHVAAAGQMAGETEASHAVAAVAEVLRHHVSEGELADVVAILPTKLRPLFQPKS
jgi:uncharacterized protein (DUF2267 family)